MPAAEVRFGGMSEFVDPVIIEALLDHPRVGIILPTLQGALQLECHLEAGIYPTLEVGLLPIVFLSSSIDELEECILFCEHYERVLIAHARIIENVVDRRLMLLVTRTQYESQKRDFFRVDTVIGLQHWHADKKNSSVGKSVLQVVNLSGNGLRFTTEGELNEGDQLGFQITLSQYSEPLSAVGRVVRVLPSRTAKKEVVVELFEIEHGAQDRVVSFCIREQTRQVRLKSSI